MKRALWLSLACISVFVCHAQQITYSEPDRDDVRSLEYDVIGKMNGNILVHKNYRDLHYFCVYDNDMKMTSKSKMDYLPERIFNPDFLQYSDHVYMFYQYQKRNVVYFVGVKLDGNGKRIGEPVQMDTTEIGYAAGNRIYSIATSEDKQKILILKVNARNEKTHYLTTALFDQSLQVIHRSRIGVSMPGRNSYLKNFQVDNDGDLMCLLETGTAQQDNVGKLAIFIKPAMADAYASYDLKLNNIYLDEMTVKVDNVNRHFLVASLFSKQRRGNIDGLYSILWDKRGAKPVAENVMTFSDELRGDARGESSVKMALNDYYVRQVIMKKDGGFILTAESIFSSSRGVPMTRWDYLYGGAPYDYFNNPYYYPGYRNNVFNNITRYYAENIAVLSYDINGKLEWSNIIRKSQYDDNSENFISYGLINTGDLLHFVFNVQEKREMILTEQNISPDGQVTRSPTSKNLDRGYDFMPREGKQVGARELIVPCQYRNFVCFAKLDF